MSGAAASVDTGSSKTRVDRGFLSRSSLAQYQTTCCAEIHLGHFKSSVALRLVIVRRAKTRDAVMGCPRIAVLPSSTTVCPDSQTGGIIPPEKSPSRQDMQQGAQFLGNGLGTYGQSAELPIAPKEANLLCPQRF